MANVQDDDIVLDFFAGSGTTLKVALDMSMDAIGIDIQPDYVEQIKERTGWNKRIDATYELIPDEEIKTE